jgi:hypothetical protein
LTRLRSGRPLKATDVAAEFEVNVRTAYRDLDFLRDEWRVPLEFDRAKGSYLLTEPMTSLPPVALSQGELIRPPATTSRASPATRERWPGGCRDGRALVDDGPLRGGRGLAPPPHHRTRPGARL